MDCPFCGEPDFSLHALKLHLMHDCTDYHEIDVTPVREQILSAVCNGTAPDSVVKRLFDAAIDEVAGVRG
jgi:hypothetical protein